MHKPTGNRNVFLCENCEGKSVSGDMEKKTKRVFSEEEVEE